jgi:antitoxin component YwqK of YwqJK toxin-antitoxin module
LYEYHFKNGLLDSVQKSWCNIPSIYCCQEYNFKDGVFHGKNREWFQNGKLKQEDNYKNGIRHGISVQYYENGLKEIEYEYNMGKIMNNLYWDSLGKPIKSKKELSKHFSFYSIYGKDFFFPIYQDGYFDLNLWHDIRTEDFLKFNETKVKNGIRVSKKYEIPICGTVYSNYLNGRFRYKKNYLVGKLNGKRITYYKNGLLKVELFSNENGNLDGIQRYYYRNSKLKIEAMYQNGILKTEKCFDKNGNPVNCLK